MLITKDGYNFAFDAKACEDCKGACCIGESGYIWATTDEIANIAKYLNRDFNSFVSEYIKKVGYRYSLKEIPYNDGFRCVFFNTKNSRCDIYPVRPKQCATFPFWEHFKTNFKELEEECQGILKL